MSGIGRSRLVILALLLSACSGSTDVDGDRPSAKCKTEACRLAALDGGDQQAPAESLIHQYQIALDALGDNCNESEEQLGAYAVTAREQLSDGGVEESLLNIISDINDGMARGVRDDCGKTFIQWTLLRVGT